MDEPFSALDVLTAETLRTDLLDLWCEGRLPIRAILMVTHNIEEAVLMSDRILLLSSNPGRIIAEIKIELRARDPPRSHFPRHCRRHLCAHDGTASGDRPAGRVCGTGIGMVLPRSSSNALSGLVELLLDRLSTGGPTFLCWPTNCRWNRTNAATRRHAATASVRRPCRGRCQTY